MADMTGAAPDGVSIRAVSKRYGTFTALDTVSLDVRKGEFLSILGPSGSGKSTLLGMLGGFVRPDSGSLWIDGRDVTRDAPHKRNIGIVFQNYALFPHLNVADNILFPLRARGVPKIFWPERLRAALDMVELSGFAHRRITELSGGQRQRVALARAMIFEPALILMDEPLSALDKQLRETMQIELKHLHARLAATIIYVTHDQREALTMSDRIAVMNKGRIVQLDTPIGLHDAPDNAFVAGFIGEATLLPVRRLDSHFVQLEDMVLATARAVPDHGDLRLVLHPEKLATVRQDAPVEGNRLRGTVTDTLFQGDSTRLFIRLASGERIAMRVSENHRERQHLSRPGDDVTLELHAQDTIVVPGGPG
ncbi:ABC transporter ATP-binding protein [Gluconacetobacter tumulisoli]|uniref:ABC transporter ATP-binding protein n=2 Tax=Gluconacetobacter tumulisoli TaxID=1286189 RepID=A0A7W4KA27_9PROT|nr:ABC transporter ATP-binding protein [Gluconacetobacter tumulisoli]